jgi:hypothetical protein
MIPISALKGKGLDRKMAYLLRFGCLLLAVAAFSSIDFASFNNTQRRKLYLIVQIHSLAVVDLHAPVHPQTRQSSRT